MVKMTKSQSNIPMFFLLLTFAFAVTAFGISIHNYVNHVTEDGVHTLTNKTLTAPIITSHTTAERDTFANVEGRIIYNSDVNKLQVFINGSYETIASSS